MAKESFLFFKNYSFFDFILSDKWRPNYNKFGALNIITGTLYIAFLGVLIALPIGFGFSIFLCFFVPRKIKDFLNFLVLVLASIPSVVYGFLGLVVLVKGFEILGKSSGESVLVGGIILSIMVLPFIINVNTQSIEILKHKYENHSNALGVDKLYFIQQIIIRNSLKGIFVGVILSLGRAIGETMAVMMVIGNAHIFPNLFGKSSTISSTIALEMGMVEAGSIHYQALFAMGLFLVLMIVCINFLIDFLKKKLI